MPCFRPVRGVLLDLDGVLYRGDTAVEGAVDFLARLAAAGIALVAVTNHSGRTPQQVAQKLAGLGPALSTDAIITSACVTGRYVAALGVSSARVVGTPALEFALAQAGVPIDPGSREAVVVGYAPRAGFGELAAAATVLHEGAAFIATNADGSVPHGDGIWPDAGPTVAFLAAASGRQATVVGKPNRWLFEEGLRRLDLAPTEAVMVGDTLATDIRGGHAVGCRTLWFTGGRAPTTAPGGAEPAERPTWTAASLDEAAQLLENAADENGRTSRHS